MKPLPKSMIHSIRQRFEAPSRSYQRALGEVMRAWRLARNIEQKDMAVRLKISQSGYSRMECGDTAFSAEKLMMACKELEVSLDTVAEQVRAVLE
jgi:transcriptional regulator with XRE-family HTH domain